jgi:dihydrofolate synthase/folylpolyglutamate synthase
MLAEVLRNDFSYKISRFEVVEGLENVTHKGRLEFYKNILFDGAHNVAGARALKEFFDEFIKQPIILVFGAMKDKDLSEIAKILFPKAEYIIFTKPNNPRSMETEDLIKHSPENFDKAKVFQSQTVEEALEIAQKISVDENLICVTGSLYLVGEAQKLLNNKSEI